MVQNLSHTYPRFVFATMLQVLNSAGFKGRPWNTLQRMGGLRVQNCSTPHPKALGVARHVLVVPKTDLSLTFVKNKTRPRGREQKSFKGGECTTLFVELWEGTRDCQHGAGRARVPFCKLCPTVLVYPAITLRMGRPRKCFREFSLSWGYFCPPPCLYPPSRRFRALR